MPEGIGYGAAAKAKISKSKARKILKDKKVHGKPLTGKQRRFFGAVLNKAKDGTLVTTASNGDEVAEGEPTKRRQNESARNLIKDGLRGMQDGGIVGPTFGGASGESDAAAAGLRALAAAAQQYPEMEANIVRDAFIKTLQAVQLAAQEGLTPPFQGPLDVNSPELVSFTQEVMRQMLANAGMGGQPAQAAAPARPSPTPAARPTPAPSRTPTP